MSELNLKPEFDLLGDEDSVRTLISRRQPGADGAGSAQSPLRSLRRRADGLRLRAPSDDGFHLFRVY
jgi:hypothetical protein